MINKRNASVTGSVLIVAAGAMIALAQSKRQNQESEREVQETEVPAAALATLKELAGSATITEFAEEIEHGHTFYEGSWMGSEGKVDVLVTDAGDVVEVEEKIPTEKVPAAARAAVTKMAGSDATIKFEKKTFFVYEAHYKKDGRNHEVIFTPDGRRFYEEGKSSGDRDDDNEDD